MPVAWRNLSAHNGGGRNAIERPLGVACCRVACPMGIEHVTRPNGWFPVGPFWNSWSRKRSEEHTSALQSLMRKSYAVFCLTKKKHNTCRCSAASHLLAEEKSRYLKLLSTSTVLISEFNTISTHII